MTAMGAKRTLPDQPLKISCAAMDAPDAPVPLAPKFVIIDDFLPDNLVAELEDNLMTNEGALRLQELGGSPTGGYYSALRRLWVHEGSLGPIEPAFCDAIAGFTARGAANVCNGWKADTPFLGGKASCGPTNNGSADHAGR